MQASSVSEVILTSRENYANKILQKITIAYQLRDHSKPISAATATSNVDDENTQNTRQNLEELIKRLKNEVASLKKDHVAPPQQVIPVQRQILPAPPSKPSTQKIILDCYNNQMATKNLQTASILNGGQQTNKIKNVFKFTQKTMETLSIYEKQF